MRHVRDLSSAGFRIVLELEVRRLDCRRCGTVKRERLDFLADNAHFTKRFAFYVGRRCRQASIRDVAKELKLDWDTVKTLEKQYMQAQLKRAGTPGPRAVGIDEISIRKGHSYRIVVSDLDRKRPIWFGGTDRSEASMAAFYDWLGHKKTRKIKLAVMDMWKPFRNVTKDKAPQAAILFDKFHIMRHLGEALDKVRKTEYARLSGKNRRFIKGQKYNLLSRHENLTPGGQTLAQDFARRQQAPQHCLRPQGGIRPALGLRARGLGAAFLRQLESEPQMAASRTLRALRRDDRSPLGRHRRLLQTGKQGLARLCRRPQQQNSRLPATSLWVARRRISKPQGSHLHAASSVAAAETLSHRS
jgi:transposase